MLDVSEIKYSLVIMDETGKTYNITDYVENLGWEENEKELAVRISFRVENENTTEGRLSTLAKLGCKVFVFATDETGAKKEVARGFIVDWRPSISGSKNKFEVKAYDELFLLQKSQDNLFYPEGSGTQSILNDIFSKWQITMAEYDGPNVPHEKQVFKAKRISDIIVELLDDAKKKGGGKTIIIADKGNVSIKRWGKNKTIYCFDCKNAMTQEHLLSMDGFITRVKIVGQANNDGKTEIEAIEDGKTEFGIFQKIYARGKEETLDDAKKAAKEILEEEGELKEEITVQAPDIPFIRKGDMVHCNLGTIENYYFIKGIRHDVESRKMQMDLKLAE